MKRRLYLMPLVAFAALAGCGASDKDEPIAVSIIGSRADLTSPVARLPSPGSKAILEATAQGLVAFDASGDVVPALAQRWIVEDDGLSYIFRLRPAKWPDGTAVQARMVAALLEARIKSYARADLKGGLDAVRQVVAMTGEVIEIRLAVPRPNFLQILAQPQMAVVRNMGGDIGGSGPYRAQWRGGAMRLTPVADPLAEADEGEQADAGSKPHDRRTIRAERASIAILRFREAGAALVLGGRYQDTPLLAGSGLNPELIRFDPAPGLFGLAVASDDPFLADDDIRQALSMAIERERLPRWFGQSRWVTMTAMIPGQFDPGGRALQPAWAASPIAVRRAEAAAKVAAWRGAGKTVPSLRIALPRGSGSRLLFGAIAADMRSIGVGVRLVAPQAQADLRLVDEVAAFDNILWYLGRLECGARQTCGLAAQALLDAAVAATLPAERQQRMTEVQQLVLDRARYIPLAQPLRWSLVSRRLEAFQSNARARHPLNALERSPD